MNDVLQKLTEKKQKLDAYMPLPGAVIKNMDEWYKVELTYTSNAIEGNTLSRAETALVVEKGITVEGKSIREHLEAINHAQAVDFIKQSLVQKKRENITEQNILAIHKIILQKIDDTYAGRYRDVSVRIAGSTVVLPNYLKVPARMHEFITWLKATEGHVAQIAAEAHLRFESIHPFVDGNGRVGRLLMNVLLMQGGYPPAIIRKEDRRRYITSLEEAQTEGNATEYYSFIYESIDRSLDIYLESIKGK